MSVPCPSCGSENAADGNFCVTCGGPLALACPACGTAARPHDFYCGHCGAKLATQAPPTPRTYTPRHLAKAVLGLRSAATGERKYVTVLFCDIVKSSVLVRRLGDEAFHDLMEEFFLLTLAEIHVMGGTINQFLGDGFMALFGAPMAHEDHTRRAVIAAVALRARVARALGRCGVTLRIGIGTGSVVVGRIGDDLRADYTAFGDTVVLASRLQAAASPGEIYLSEDAAERVQGYFRLGRVAMVPWNDQLVGAFQVLGQGTRRYRLDAIDRPLTPFVGRREELALLCELVAKLRSAGGRTVDIIGEPGLGKSRLLVELRAMIPTERVIEGRCVSYGGAVPYLPVVDLLRNTCGIRAQDDGKAVAARLQEHLVALGLDASQSLPFLNELVGQDGSSERHALDPATVKARTFAVLRDLWAAESRRAPLVLILEDLHWIDRTSEELLVGLANAAPEMSMFLITTARTGYCTPWGGNARASTLKLEPLAVAESRRVVDACFGDLADATFADAIVERGEGNPFFLEELANSARHDGARSRDAVPRTIEEVLAARIDQLSDETKRAVQTAAVLGREFSLSLIADVWDGERAVLSELNELARRELVFQGTRDMQGEDLTFRFKHALTQEVAYKSLLEKARRVLHGRAGHAIERLHGAHLEPCQELLAHHYARSDEHEAAAHYLILANRKAARRNAMEEAIEYFYDALRTLETLPDNDQNRRRRLRLVFDQTGEFHFLHRHREYYDLILRHRPLVQEVDDRELLGAFHARLGHRQWTSNEVVASIATLGHGAELCEACGNAEDAASAYAILAWAHLMHGDYGQVCEFRDKALEKIGVSFHPVWYSFARAAAILGYTWTGAWNEALAEGELAVQEGRRRGDRAIVSFNAAWVAHAFLHRREWQQAREWAEFSLAEAPTVYFQTFPQTFLARAQCELGEAAQGLATLAAIEPLVEASAHLPAWCLVASWLGDAYLATGQRKAAATLFEKLNGVAESGHLAFFAGIASRVLGELALAQGELVEALMRLRYAASVAQDTGARNELGLARWSLARATLQTGDVAGASGHFAGAAQILDELGNREAHDRILLEAKPLAERAMR